MRGAGQRQTERRNAQATDRCYVASLANKTKTKGRHTIMQPITPMEEGPAVSEQERAELTNSLKEAEARIKAGEAVDYDPKTFKDRLIDLYRGAGARPH